MDNNNNNNNNDDDLFIVESKDKGLPTITINVDDSDENSDWLHSVGGFGGRRLTPEEYKMDIRKAAASPEEGSEYNPIPTLSKGSQAALKRYVTPDEVSKRAKARHEKKYEYEYADLEKAAEEVMKAKGSEDFNDDDDDEDPKGVVQDYNNIALDVDDDDDNDDEEYDAYDTDTDTSTDKKVHHIAIRNDDIEGNEPGNLP